MQKGIETRERGHNAQNHKMDANANDADSDERVRLG